MEILSIQTNISVFGLPLGSEEEGGGSLLRHGGEKGTVLLQSFSVDFVILIYSRSWGLMAVMDSKLVN